QKKETHPRAQYTEQQPPLVPQRVANDETGDVHGGEHRFSTCAASGTPIPPGGGAARSAATNSRRAAWVSSKSTFGISTPNAERRTPNAQHSALLSDPPFCAHRPTIFRTDCPTLKAQHAGTDSRSSSRSSPRPLGVGRRALGVGR